MFVTVKTGSATGEMASNQQRVHWGFLIQEVSLLELPSEKKTLSVPSACSTMAIEMDPSIAWPTANVRTGATPRKPGKLATAAAVDRSLMVQPAWLVPLASSMTVKLLLAVRLKTSECPSAVCSAWNLPYALCSVPCT